MYSIQLSQKDVYRFIDNDFSHDSEKWFGLLQTYSNLLPKYEFWRQNGMFLAVYRGTEKVRLATLTIDSLLDELYNESIK